LHGNGVPPGLQVLACTAEQLALRAIIEEARVLLLADPEVDEAVSNSDDALSSSICHHK